MKCTNCGADLSGNELFCSNCGNKIQTTERRKINPAAGGMPQNDGFRPEKPKKKGKVIAAVSAALLAVAAAATVLIANFGKSADSSVSGESTGNIVADCTDVAEKVTDAKSAYAVLNSVSGIFGFEDAEDVLGNEEKNVVLGDTYYRFEQLYKDIPVYGRSIVVAADEDGNVFNISGNYKEIGELDVTPKINADKAKKNIEKKAKKEFGGEATVSDTELVIYTDAVTESVAWTANVSGVSDSGNFNSCNIFIDADNGNVIYREDVTDEFQTTKEYAGQKGGKKSVVVEEFETTDGSKNYQLRDDSRNIAVYTPRDKYLWYRDILDGKTASSLVCWKNDENPDTSAVDAMYNVSKTYDFYGDALEHYGMDGNRGEIPVYVHVSGYGYDDERNEKTNNAFFWPYPEPNVLAFTVKTDNTNEYSADLFVVGHEYTHGVMNGICKIEGHEGYRQAIKESYADVMGVFVKASYNGGEPEWDTAVRNLENPEENGYPTKMSQYDESEDGYYNGSIISHTAYLMWKGADGKKGIKDIEALAKLWYGSMYMLNNDSDFSHCRTAVEITANRLLAKNILSEADVECVKAAFDETEISQKVLCGEVMPEPELCVSGANGGEYYNYRYKVEKINADSLSEAVKNSDKNPKTVEEKDVTEDRIVSLSSLKDKGIYRITVSDLGDEPGETQTKYVLVSDGEYAKSMVNFYTDYKFPVSQVTEDINSALDGVKSVHLSQNTFSDYSVTGSKVNMTVGMESDIDIENGIVHIGMTTEYGGNSVYGEYYMESDGDLYDIYMSVNGVWVRQNGVSENELCKLGNTVVSMDGIKFYLNNLENVYVENDYETQTVSGVLSREATEEALEKAGLLKVIEQLSNNVTETELKSLLNDLSPMEISFSIDTDTHLPIKMTVDMTETTDSIYRNIKNIASDYGESISYSIKSNKAVTEFTDYNSATGITVPNQAYDGTEYNIIEGKPIVGSSRQQSKKKSDKSDKDDSFDKEAEVQSIRKWYYAAQEKVDSFDKKTGDNGIIKYFDNGELVRADIPSGAENSYTAFCYFRNGELYFVFEFDKTKENRYYFKNEKMFRWIDESGNINESDADNSEFTARGNQILKRVKSGVKY